MSVAAPTVMLSVVVPVFNEEANVRPLVERTRAAIEALGLSFEFVFVDDGSRDRTYEALRHLAAADPRVRLVRFTRNYGQEAAVEALYLHASGAWILQMDGDLQNPPEEIQKLWAKKDEGFDVVYGLRQKRKDTLFRVWASRAMQWLMRQALAIELPPDVSTFRLMRASVARHVAALPERRKFFSALLVWSGARIGTVEVAHAARFSGTTNYNFTKLLNHTFDLVVGFSSKPLRFIGNIGLGAAAFGLLLGLWAVFRKVFYGYGNVGWPSIFALVAFMGGLQLLALSVIGEYIARIYIQVQGRPLFNVAERRNFDDAPESATAGAPSLLRPSVLPVERASSQRLEDPGP
jgi:glycosyltransferase involved in cell wall biosynthesis